MTCPICNASIPIDKMEEHFESVHDIGGSRAPVTSGLHNGDGQHSCFLNAALQALWHTDSFRRAIVKVSPKGPMHSMIQSLFANIEHNQRSGAIPADLLRSHLADLFAPLQRFQLGHMDDAGEALEAILETLHREHVGVDEDQNEDDGICNPMCVAHAVFGLTTVDQTSCGACCANSDPEVVTNLVYRAYATDILAAAREHRTPVPRNDNMVGGIGGWLHKHLGSDSSSTSSNVDANVIPPEAMLSGVLHSAVESMPKRTCPSHDLDKEKNDKHRQHRQLCQGSAKVQRFCIGTKPKVLAIQIVWPSDSASKSEVRTILESLDYTLRLEKLFMGSDETISNNADTRSVSKDATYRRLGVINFYGKHYTSAFSVHPRGGQYVLCDDERVKLIGQWDDAKKRLVAARWMPTMVLYESTNVRKSAATTSSLRKKSVVPTITPQQASSLQNQSVAPDALPPPPSYDQLQFSNSAPSEMKVKAKRPRQAEGTWGRRYYVVIRVEPGQTGLGMHLRKFENGTKGLEVIGWDREIDGSIMPAQQSRRINIGDRILSFNDHPVGDMDEVDFHRLVSDYLRPCAAGYGVTLELRLQGRPR